MQNTPEDDPRRVEFNRLHHISVRYEGAVLFLAWQRCSFLVRELSLKP